MRPVAAERDYDSGCWIPRRCCSRIASPIVAAMGLGKVPARRECCCVVAGGGELYTAAADHLWYQVGQTVACSPDFEAALRTHISAPGCEARPGRACKANYAAASAALTITRKRPFSGCAANQRAVDVRW